jgi:RNA polymerase sigma-70 factor (ECF subfamily)
LKASSEYLSAQSVQVAARRDAAPEPKAQPLSGENALPKRGETLPQTIAQIYDSYFDFVWRNARRLGIPEASADDVTQDVFIVVQRRIDSYDGRASMQAWIFGILLRVVQDHRRSFRRKGARHVPLEHEVNRSAGAAHDPSPLDQLERLQRVRLVEQLLSEIDEDKRCLLILSEIEQWTLREIAQFYGSNINTIYSRLRAAKRAFEQAYERSQSAKEPLP